ncbi:MAG TPA: hypothetical protein VEY67_04785 [Candidatus Dormibacteraeota bacterium]|nr:hypothetical protein [Candidatus Dormibacteraeota bacterium]
MIRLVLVACGLVAAFLGTWRGYDNARDAVAPLRESGDATRASVDAGRPLVARTRVRRFMRGAAVSMAWLALAMYGLLFIATAAAMPVDAP